MTTPPTLTHVRLLVDDYAACFEFYRDVLGYEATFGDAESGYADFDAGGPTLALFDRAEMLGALDGGSSRDPADGGSSGDPTDGETGDPRSNDGADREDRVAVVLAAEDLDRTHERLRERGVAFVAPPTDRPEWGIRTAHLRDPDGTLIELNEPLE